MLKLNHKVFFSPEEGEGKGLEGKDTLTLLEDEPEEVLELKPEKTEKEKEDEEPELDEDGNPKVKEDDELDKLEDELKEPKEEDLELIAPVAAREILAKYPKLWKDFPHLRNSYYRERAFTEIVATIEDAKEAVSKAETLDRFDADLRDGNLENALKAVKGSGDDAFNKLVDNYLPNLYKTDKDAYLHVTGNIIKTVTIRMLNEAKTSNNAELKEAAELLNEFVFRTKEVTEPTRLSREKTDTKETDEVKNREEKFLRQQFETARDGVNSKVTNIIKSTIEANIDPRKSMTDYVRKNAVKDCQERVIELLSGDKRLTVLIDKLYESAFKSNFSADSMNKIRSAYLSRAKALMLPVIKEKRNEAMKGSSRREVIDDEPEEKPERKGTLPVGRSTSSSNSGTKSVKDKAREIPANVSTADYLMQDD